MGKKKKKAKSIKKIANSRISVLKSGKVKFEKGETISLNVFSERSIAGTIISRVDGIISKEVPESNTNKSKTEKHSFLMDMEDYLRATGTMDGKTQTIIIPIPKKKACFAFDFLSNSILGVLLRTSTLATVYKNVKEKWVDLNKDDKSAFTNVMYIPSLMIFGDSFTGRLLEKPILANVLILAMPSEKQLDTTVTTENDVEITEIRSRDDVKKDIIGEIMESVIRLGATNIILDPFSHKVLRKDPLETILIWNTALQSKRVNQNVETVSTVFTDESLYISWENNVK